MPRELASEFQQASSKGAFFNGRIKGRFTCHELASAAVPRRRRAAND